MDNRELATLILLGVMVFGIAILAARKPDLRASLKSVGASMVAPAIVIPTVFLAAWIFGLIVVAKSLGLWDDGLIFSAILWSGATGVVLFFQVGTHKGDKAFLRPALHRALAVGVFIEIAASFFAFDLWVELVLAPVAMLLLLLSLIADRDPESASAKNLVDGLLGFIGIAMALAWVVQFISGFDDFDWDHAGRQLGMPIWLTLGLLPYLYLVALWTGYDHAFRRIKMKSANWQVPPRVKLGFMLAVHGQATKANAISATAAHELARAPGVRSAWRAGRAFLRAEKERVTKIQEAADRLERYAGADGVDDDGRRLDQREFKGTKAALQWLATAHMGWCDRKDRYKDDLLDILTFDELPEDHEITMRISDDGRAGLLGAARSRDGVSPSVRLLRPPTNGSTTALIPQPTSPGSGKNGAIPSASRPRIGKAEIYVGRRTVAPSLPEASWITVIAGQSPRIRPVLGTTSAQDGGDMRGWFDLVSATRAGPDPPTYRDSRKSG